MKDFFKMLLASVLGMVLVITICFFLFIGSLVALISVQPKTTEIAPNSILRIALNKPIQDRTPDNPLEFISPYSFSVDIPLGLNSILKGIERAKYDPRIKGIYLDLNGMFAGIATTEEIRNALIDYKNSGKFVIAYADNYTQTSYFLATIADKIYINPFGSFQFSGLSSQVMFFKNMLEKLGIEMQIIRHGKFKSAVEPFMLDKMSPENREQVSTYMGSIWNTVLQTINASRGISIDSLNIIANGLEMNSAEDAVKLGFMDGVYYKDQVISELCKYTQVKSEKDLKIVNIGDYANAPNKEAKLAKNKIAIIYAEGTITQGQGSDGISAQNMSAAIRKARSDSAIKAVVFRINSPGGDALASEIIARELELTRDVKPVIVSMGDVAASGGYWLASASNTIMASHTTITGSIGVFGVIPNVEKGLKDKLGLSVDVVKTNEHSDFINIYRPLNTRERNYLQKNVENIYAKFINKVAVSRGMTINQVDSIGQGRVWSGNNAFQNNLIDEFGGLQDAIKLAVNKANLTDYRIEELPRSKSPFELIMSSMDTKIKSFLTKSELEKSFHQYEYILNSVKNYGIQARLPYEIIIE